MYGVIAPNDSIFAPDNSFDEYKGFPILVFLAAFRFLISNTVVSKALEAYAFSQDSVSIFRSNV